MNIKVVYIAMLSILQGCYAQNSTEQAILLQKDHELLTIYDTYYQNRHDYGATNRDTILTRFKNTLRENLQDYDFTKHPMDSLATKTWVLTSDDQKLKIISWDELNGGTWHIYNSMYQYATNEKLYTGSLSLEQQDEKKNYFTDIYHYKIVTLEKDAYLVWGYGTHGQGHDFYTLRLLSFDTTGIRDCKGCFNGEDRLVFYKPRAEKNPPVYDPSKKTISYPEYIEDPNTSWSKKTGKTNILSYQNGQFIKNKP